MHTHTHTHTHHFPGPVHLLRFRRLKSCDLMLVRRVSLEVGPRRQGGHRRQLDTDTSCHDKTSSFLSLGEIYKLPTSVHLLLLKLAWFPRAIEIPEDGFPLARTQEFTLLPVGFRSGRGRNSFWHRQGLEGQSSPSSLFAAQTKRGVPSLLGTVATNTHMSTMRRDIFSSSGTLMDFRNHEKHTWSST